MNKADADLEGTALLSLAKDNVPTDIQTLLIQGDPLRDIPPHSLLRAMTAMLRRFNTIADKYHGDKP